MTTLNKFPTLYKQTSSGKVQQWTVSVSGNSVTTVYGLTDGKHQTTIDIVKEGKNLGRSNATTPETQAQAEAQQSFDAKLKDGYVTDKEVAATTKNTLEAIEPMLAHPIEKKEKYAIFPAFAQPKLDGLRMIAILKKGRCHLYSRTQKEFVTLPHIVQEIEKVFKGRDVILDGEAYNHKYKKNFNKIIELIKRDDVHPDHTLVQYHIYDVVAPGDYDTRTASAFLAIQGATYLKEVDTVNITSREELDAYQAECVEKGYEGCMYRNLTALYENKRSSGLLKVKTFQDAEFTIVGFEEGSGKLMGKMGAFFCDIGDGRQFKASPACTLEEKEAYWNNRNQYLGKQLTVQFQNLTPDGMPRFPIAKGIRDYE